VRPAVGWATTEAFILFQQVVGLGLPVWVRGGIGRHTAAAVVAGGGAGVVLDGQLALLREAGIGEELRRAVQAMDGSETRVVGGHRFLTRPDLPPPPWPTTPRMPRCASFLGSRLRHDRSCPFGQDGGFAAGLAQRYVTVGGVVQAVQAAITEHLDAAAAAPARTRCGRGRRPRHPLPDRPGPDDAGQRSGRLRRRGGRRRRPAVPRPGPAAGPRSASC
jgi:hypothetical protein